MTSIARFLLAATVVAVGITTIGCSGEQRPVAFEANLVQAMKYQIRDGIPMDQASKDTTWVVTKMFGTPDQPTLPTRITEDEELASLLSMDRLTRASGDKDADGRGLYQKHCVLCHGITGNGRGIQAAALNPYPRDYRLGKFKFKSTKLGSKPTREDLAKLIRDGIVGTAMKKIPELSEADVQALTDYVIYLSIRGELERKLIENGVNNGILEDGRRILDTEFAVLADNDQALIEQLKNVNQDTDAGDLIDYENYLKFARRMKAEPKLEEQLKQGDEVVEQLTKDLLNKYKNDPAITRKLTNELTDLGADGQEEADDLAADYQDARDEIAEAAAAKNKIAKDKAAQDSIAKEKIANNKAARETFIQDLAAELADLLVETYEDYVDMGEDLESDAELKLQMEKASKETTGAKLLRYENYVEAWEFAEDTAATLADKWLNAKDDVLQIPEPPSTIPVAQSRADYVAISQSDRAEELAASVKRGEELFVGKIASCSKCHGPKGLGNGTTNDYDDWTKDWTTLVGLKPEDRESLIPLLARAAMPPINAKPRNFQEGYFHGGSTSADLYRRIMLGIEGTPMPAATFVEGQFEQDDVWHLINFVRSLQESDGDQGTQSAPTQPVTELQANL